MKRINQKLLIFFCLTTLFTSCEKQSNIKLIPFTSSSEKAKELMKTFMLNEEQRKWYLQDDILNQIYELDKDFYLTSIFWNRSISNDERRDRLINAYENRSKASEIESSLIEAAYIRRIKNDITKQDEIVDKLIDKYPDYYELYILSGQIKNQMQNPSGSEKRWKEAIAINPKSFNAHINLAFLHVPTGGTNLLPEKDRNLEIGEKYLIDAQKILPNAYHPSRFLGNIYRAQGDFEKAESAYQKSLDLMGESFDLKNEDQSTQYGNSLLMLGHVNTFQSRYDKARKYYQEAIDISNSWWKVQIAVLNSHTFMYEKKYNEAIIYLNEFQKLIPNMEFENGEIQKNNQLFYVEFSKFLAFGHSLNEEESLKSMNVMNEIRDLNKKLLIDRALDKEEKNRIESFVKADALETEIWYNILFGYYEKANVLLEDLKKISEQNIDRNPNALNTYNKLVGYNSIMEGNPEKSLEFYGKLPQQNLDDDNYHRYFYALALRATGKNDESKSLMIKLANDNFATWQNSIVKNLAKAQIKTNI